jgi:hypothetical protein
MLTKRPAEQQQSKWSFRKRVGQWCTNASCQRWPGEAFCHVVGVYFCTLALVKLLSRFETADPKVPKSSRPAPPHSPLTTPPSAAPNSPDERTRPEREAPGRGGSSEGYAPTRSGTFHVDPRLPRWSQNTPLPPEGFFAKDKPDPKDRPSNVPPGYVLAAVHLRDDKGEDHIVGWVYLDADFVKFLHLQGPVPPQGTKI